MLCFESISHGIILAVRNLVYLISRVMRSPVLFLLLAISASAQVIAPSRFEAPVILSAAALLGSDATGPSHRVREKVITDGYMAHFTIDSDFGEIECIGLSQAKARIHELGAIRKLVDVSKSDLFADGLKRSFEQPIDAVKNIVKDPVGSVTAMPKTVGHFFKKVGRSVSDAASNAKKHSENNENTDAIAGATRATKGVIGFDSAKLECAKQLGVDPYTDNARLQGEIDKVSWAFFAGGLPLRVGAAVASGGASLALTATKVVGLPDEIYALTPSELVFRNQQAMEMMDVSENISRRFASNDALSITLRRSIIRSLQVLSEVKNRAAVIEVAANCEERRQAEFLDQALMLLARRQQSGKCAYSALEIIGRLPCAVDAAGVLEVAAPVDFLSWTPDVSEFAHRDDLVGRKPVLLLSGGLSELTRTELGALGWTLGTP